ncbi:unnamed protein product [Mytilus edulis]|uniref:Uncharacterized protein n=1 Tax=Mytilus edulis TaxID=6550 RepID=A0A8S3RZ68_MYTED|nr:unnamed protein product [Mytilus edulis]
MEGGGARVKGASKPKKEKIRQERGTVQEEQRKHMKQMIATESDSESDSSLSSSLSSDSSMSSTGNESEPNFVSSSDSDSETTHKKKNKHKKKVRSGIKDRPHDKSFKYGSSAHICQRVTSSVVYMMKQSGHLLLNYLDDFAGAEKSEDANVVFDLLRKILVRCDNQSTVMVLNSGCTRDAYMQCCLREILFYAAKYNFEIKAVHFPGVENRTADILSRWHSDSRFEDLFYELPVVRIEPGTFLIVSDSIAKYVKLENADVFAFRGASIGEITYQLNKNKGSIYEGYKCLIIHCGTNDIHILSIDQFKSAYGNLISTAKLFVPSMVIAMSVSSSSCRFLRKQVKN